MEYLPSASLVLLFLESSVPERHCVGSSPEVWLHVNCCQDSAWPSWLCALKAFTLEEPAFLREL